MASINLTKALVFYHSDAKTEIISLSKILGYKHLEKKEIYEGAVFFVGNPPKKITILRISNSLKMLRLWDADFCQVTELPIQSLEMCFWTGQRRMERDWSVDTRTPEERKRCKPKGLTKPQNFQHYHFVKCRESNPCCFAACPAFSWSKAYRLKSVTEPDPRPENVVLPTKQPAKKRKQGATKK